MDPGLRPSWRYLGPNGLVLCVGCWRPITARELGWNLCLRPARR